MKYVPLNLALMSHPANWVIIVLMVLIAGLGLSLVFHPSHELGEVK